MTKSSIALVLPVLPVVSSDVETDAGKFIIRERSELFVKFHEIGEQVARAAITRTDALRYFANAVRLGAAHIAKKGSDDAERCYLAVANAHNAILADRKDVDLMPADAKSAKSAISVFRSIARPAVLAQGEDWIDRVSRQRDLLGAECKLSAYMAVNRANVRVTQESDKLVGNRYVYATDEEIADYIRNKPAEKKTACEDLADLLDRMVAVSKDHAEIASDPALLDGMEKFIKLAGDWIHVRTVVLG